MEERGAKCWERSYQVRFESGLAISDLTDIFPFSVIRNLLTNIVEIENQRLEIERQRFEYEKTVGNELLSMLRTFIGSQTKEQTEPEEEKTIVG
jgi:hypothetical protein